MVEESTVYIYGIRHHGPGSARSLLRALEELRPDAILVEGPPDAAEVLPLLTHEEMQPPVALLVYRPDLPRQAVYYPLARFSPEWQAVRYGLTQGVAVRFMDLPQAYQLAMVPDEAAGDDCPASGSSGEPTNGAGPADGVGPAAEHQADSPGGVGSMSEEAAPAGADEAARLEALLLRQDPLRWLAEAAGEADGERWWGKMVEERRDSAGLFAAIQEAMTALRAASPPPADPREAERESRREAFMRQTIRAAKREGFERIAVVCGAWHAPALADVAAAATDSAVADGPGERADAALLKGLPKIKVQATWAPWTDDRLAFDSGYGAGVESPGWYDHLWQHPSETAPRWLTRVARLLREQDLDASSASVIETVRLAEALAALRGRAQPGLPELTEATQAVLCAGNDAPLRLIHRKLIVGERLGAVPASTPMTPLQADLAREQRRLRLPAEASERVLDLDLRQPTGLARSHLLHRLALLGVAWGRHEGVQGALGTFREQWRLRWQPELAVALIEASRWGTTVAEAAGGRAHALADEAKDLPALTALVDAALLADLPDAVAHIMARLQAAMAITGDVAHLMEALPPLANVARYGNVRGADATSVGGIIDGLVARICIGLPGACASLDDEAAAAMLERIGTVDGALALFQREDHQAAWREVLRRLADREGLHGLIAGRATRLLLDAGALDADEAARRLSLALSIAGDPAQIAAWIEGFLGASGQLLLHDERLWTILDAWVTALAGDTITTVLPLLRRTFARFPAPERRQMGERVRSGPTRPTIAAETGEDFDLARAESVLPLVARLLGLSAPV